VDRLNNRTAIFEDDQLDNIEFDSNFGDDEDSNYIDEDTELIDEDSEEVNIYDNEDGYFDEDGEHEELSDISSGDEPNDFGVDDFGVTVGAEELGLSSGEDDDTFYEVVGTDSNFINQNGDIVVMDTSIAGDNFKLEYIDIDRIAIVQRIRKNKNVEDLIKSIQSTGLLMPVVVAPTATEGVYVLLNGFRRLLACARVGMRKIPCIINTKVNTPEIPILEALYNHCKPYTMKEIVDYIDYLEKEKGILSASMIEYLLQMENGDYTKLKDILNDDDEEIVSKLMSGAYNISTAFKKLEQRRKNESREEKDLKKAEKVYQQAEESGAEMIEGSGETADGSDALTEEEIASLAISATELDEGLEDKSLEELVAEGDSIEGYEPHQQSPSDREVLDPALAKAVKERDRNTCQCCKEGGMEYVDCNDVHHIQPVFLGGKDELKNLILVCVKCHRLIHLYSRGELHMRPFDQMDDREREKFKRIVKLGMVIRKGLALRKMKREELKKVDKLRTIGRTLGTGQVAD